MGTAIINLTRKVLPSISLVKADNIKSLKEMPEMVLGQMKRNGSNNILQVDMNRCAAAIINPQKIHTVYTEGLAGCDAVGSVMKLKDGRFLCLQSHYVPTNLEGHVKAIEKQLQTYAPHLDTSYSPRTFFNIRGVQNGEKLEIAPNPIVDKVKDVFAKMFPNGCKTSVTPYQNTNRQPFFSTANIFQFNPQNVNQLKITSVGEKEAFIDLMG